MILKRKTETMLKAIERKGREMSTSPLVLDSEMTTADLYELIGALASEVIVLRSELEALQSRVNWRA